VFIITIKPKNTRRKQKAVGRFTGKSILLQLIMEKTHEQLQMCKKFLLAKQTNFVKCKEIELLYSHDHLLRGKAPSFMPS
jgi:hypothetical protein